MRDLQKAPWPGWNTIRLIGQGSFGTVYEIQRELVDGTVETAAMKVLTIPQNPSDVTEMYSEGYDEESITATFQAHLRSIVAEYTLMRRLDGSANVVNCKDISYIQHDDGIGWDIYIRMELLTPLLKALPDSIDEKTVVKLAQDICAALALCKKYGIVHRDIKPQNIFISANGDYKLGDFGIAKTVEKTMGGTKIGTYKYMAPEVYNNQPYGSAADIYSLGLVLYWMLNERRMPFMPLPPARILAAQDEQARQRRLSGEPLPPPAHGSTELKRIVLKACAYAPKERYHTAGEMLADLKGLENRQTTDVNSIDEKASIVETNNSCRKDDAVAGCEDMASDETMATVGAFCQTESGMAGPSGEHAEKTQARKKPNKSKRKKSYGAWVIAVAVILIGTVYGIYGYSHCWFGHVWGATTCTEPETCMRCGSVRGKALGHTWQAATCTEPATCMRCGAVSGKALGHSWLAATCTKPNTCETCGATSGIALGHQWTEATYDAPKTCSVCGLTEGRALKSELFCLDMTLDEFRRKSEQLVEVARSWTRETAPQSLEEFPFFPRPVYDLVETVKSAQSDVDIADTKLTWVTNLSELLYLEDSENVLKNHAFSYIDTYKNAWERVQLEQISKNTYEIQVPADVWKGSSNPNVYFWGNMYLDGWNETLDVTYDILDGHLTSPSVGLIMSNSEYSISWEYNLWDSGDYFIDIYSYSNGRIWLMRYDATSGKLESISK